MDAVGYRLFKIPARWLSDINFMLGGKVIRIKTLKKKVKEGF